MDFSVEDHLDTVKFNHILWEGTMGERPYPDVRSGEDLRGNRQQLLEEYRKGTAAEFGWFGRKVGFRRRVVHLSKRETDVARQRGAAR